MAHLLIFLSSILIGLVGCELPVDEEVTITHQSSLTETVDTEEIAEPPDSGIRINANELFKQSSVYDVKYTYTVSDCVGRHSKSFNDLTFEILGQVIVLNQKHMILTRQNTECSQGVGVYAHWSNESDILNDIQGDFLIGDYQDWSKSYGRINVSGGNTAMGTGLSGYIRNIKVDHNNTLCTI